ncbi:MAG: pilin [Steroidobacteraceae bacterium]|nr:pilin [Steroidobacteraceae bacterium]
MAAAAKSAVAESFSQRGTAPADRLEAGMTGPATSTNGKYVESVAVTDGVITITYGANANALIAGQTLNITPFVSEDNSVAWRCGLADDPPGATGVMPGTTDLGPGTLGGPDFVKYLPAACRAGS